MITQSFPQYSFPINALVSRGWLISGSSPLVISTSITFDVFIRNALSENMNFLNSLELDSLLREVLRDESLYPQRIDFDTIVENFLLRDTASNKIVKFDTIAKEALNTSGFLLSEINFNSVIKNILLEDVYYNSLKMGDTSVNGINRDIKI